MTSSNTDLLLTIVFTVLTCLFPMMEIIQRIYFNYAHKEQIQEIEHNLKLQSGEDIETHVKNRSGLNLFWLVPVSIFLFLIEPMSVAVAVGIWVFGNMCARENSFLSPIITQQEALKVEAAKQAHFHSQFDDVGEDDEGFDYDEAAFSGGGSSKTESKPHRTDRHPDDLKFWRVVDDPSFSEQERSKAFSMILKNQAKRSGKPSPKPRRKTGREVVKKS